MLDTVATRLPPCLRAAAATAMLTEEAATLTLRQKLEVLIPHQVQGVLEMKGHLWLPGNGLTKYEILLLESPEVTAKTCNSLNPASLMPTESSSDLTHSCSAIIHLLIPAGQTC